MVDGGEGLAGVQWVFMALYDDVFFLGSPHQDYLPVRIDDREGEQSGYAR